MISSLKMGSLFTGYGGLDLAVAQHFDVSLTWTSDIDDAASKIISHHWPDIPNLGDITMVNWSETEPVDIITAGWPCQPFSHAGLRRGKDDHRALWPNLAEAIRNLRPQYVFLENVPAIARAGELARAIGDLSKIGYVGSWRCIRASDVGAPHRRERIFIFGELSDPDSLGSKGRKTPRQQGKTRPSTRSSKPADTESCQCSRSQPTNLETGRAEPKSRECTCPTADTEGNQGWQQSGNDHLDWGKFEPAIRRWEKITRSAPHPTVLGRRGATLLSPQFVEWMMGLPYGWVTNVPGVTRSDQLRALGNGVVPQQGTLALDLILNEL